MSVRDDIDISFVEAVYDDAIRGSKSLPDAERSCGRTRVDYEHMVQNGHAGRIVKWIREGGKKWHPNVLIEAEKKGGGTRPIEAPAWDAHLTSAVFRAYYEKHTSFPSGFFAQPRVHAWDDTGYHDAIERIEDRFDNQWITRIDIVDFFGALPHERVREALNRFMNPDDHKLVFELITLPSRRRRRQRRVRTRSQGVCQGNPLSPLVARMALFDLPTVIRQAGGKPYIYVDDILVLSDCLETAQESYRQLARHLGELGLDIEPSRVDQAVFAPHESFQFLQHDFRVPDRSNSQDPDDGDVPVRSHRIPCDRAGDLGSSGQFGQSSPGSGRVVPRHAGADRAVVSAPQSRAVVSVGATLSIPLPFIRESISVGPRHCMEEVSSVSYWACCVGMDLSSRCTQPSKVLVDKEACPFDTTRVNGQEDPPRLGKRSSPEGRGQMSSPHTHWWYPNKNSNQEYILIAEDLTLARRWVRAGRSVAALVRDVERVGIVQFGDDGFLSDLEFDSVLDGHLDDARAGIRLPRAPKSEWAADVLVVPIPPPTEPETLAGRVKRIDDLLHRARKATRPAATLCAICHRDDHLGVLALEALELKQSEKIAPELVGIGRDAPHLHFGLWQRRYAGGLPRRFGRFELPWVRVTKVDEDIYDIHDWRGGASTTRGHHWLCGRLRRPLAALYATFAEHVDQLVPTGTDEVLVVHHGDLQPQFFCGSETERWDPRKSDIVEPVRKVRQTFRQFTHIQFVRSNQRNGLVWSSVQEHYPQR